MLWKQKTLHFAVIIATVVKSKKIIIKKKKKTRIFEILMIDLVGLVINEKKRSHRRNTYSERNGFEFSKPQI